MIWVTVTLCLISCNICHLLQVCRIYDLQFGQSQQMDDLLMGIGIGND